MLWKENTEKLVGSKVFRLEQCIMCMTSYLDYSLIIGELLLKSVSNRNGSPVVSLVFLNPNRSSEMSSLR